MAEPAVDHWHAGAAYLYILHLDGPALAWEYLRRHSDYQRDWQCRRHCPETAQRWGLRLLEDPVLDARDAHPAWFHDQESVIHLYADRDPPPNAERFAFWSLPGRKHLIYDGRRLVLVSRWAGCCMRLAFASDLKDGMPFVCAFRTDATPCSRYRALAAELEKLHSDAPLALAAPRPSTVALRELITLQALDGALAGASLRTVAEVLFGATTVTRDWHADGALRARVRRLIRRGQRLMHGGYRHLAQLPDQAQGRFTPRSKRP